MRDSVIISLDETELQLAEALQELVHRNTNLKFNKGYTI
jgi:hypothetical protein